MKEVKLVLGLRFTILGHFPIGRPPMLSTHAAEEPSTLSRNVRRCRRILDAIEAEPRQQPRRLLAMCL